MFLVIKYKKLKTPHHNPLLKEREFPFYFQEKGSGDEVFFSIIGKREQMSKLLLFCFHIADVTRVAGGLNGDAFNEFKSETFDPGYFLGIVCKQSQFFYSKVNRISAPVP